VRKVIPRAKGPSRFGADVGAVASLLPESERDFTHDALRTNTVAISLALATAREMSMSWRAIRNRKKRVAPAGSDDINP